MRYILMLFVLLMTGAVVAAEDAIFVEGVTVRTLAIDLGEDFVTHAEFTYPTAGTAPFPTVILVHGSGPYDLDATYITAFGEPPISANFRLLAEALPQAGIGVLRYNKRGVLPDGGFDIAQIQRSTLDQLVADASAVLDAALEQPEVGPVYLYGWSEGAWVITNLATQRPDAVDGLILQGGPDGDLLHVLEYQWLEIALPYLTETFGATLTLDDVLTLPTGAVAYMAGFLLYDQTSTPERPLLNRITDANGDGQIDIEDELRPTMQTFIRNFRLFTPPTAASHQTAELLAELGLPVLILHGEQDGWVPVADAYQIAEAADATLKVYETLGHALSLTDARAEDGFGVMDAEPINDLIAWINEPDR